MEENKKDVKENNESPEKILGEIKKENKKDPKNNPKLNKQLMYVLLALGIFIIIILAMPYIIDLTKKFNYEGVEFKTIQQGELTLYNTQLPLYDSSEKKYADYNFYLRNDPRDLEKVPFEGELFLLKNVVINSEEDFKCEGYGIIAVANLRQLYETIGAKVITDHNASCDILGRYVYLDLVSGNETKIEKFGPSCYHLIINDCEILEVTERYMTEIFIKINNETKI